MNKEGFVFFDPNRRRWTWVRVVVAIAVVAFLAASVVFVKSLLIQPLLKMPDSLMALRVKLHAMEAKPHQMAERKPWEAMLQKSLGHAHQTRAALAKTGEVRAAILDDGDQRSLASFAAYAGELTHVCPEIMSVGGVPAHIRVEVEPSVLSLLHSSHAKMVPVMTNASGDSWDSDAIEGLLESDEAQQQHFIQTLRDSLRDIGAAGVLLDWQGLDPSFSDRLTVFLGKIRDALHQDDRELWLSIPVGDDLKVFDLDHIPDVVDRMVAQLHDENAEQDAPGPVAAQPWFEGWLKALLGYGDPSQWIISIGAYGYDWNTTKNHATTLSFADAMARAQRASTTSVTSQAPYYNPSFSYGYEGETHEVWFLDATTFANQLKAATDKKTGGIIVNRLGSEDPTIWKVFGKNESAIESRHRQTYLEYLDPGSIIAHVGEGDFIRAELESHSGRREVDVDASGYMTETFTAWPVYPVAVHWGGFNPHRVALSFDDGPDPEWTPKILDILKERGVHATFFILGKHAEEHPELVRRILREGHEIGSHTYTHPNLGEISTDQTILELNATERLFEWITKRSPILFRPPYNADSMPASLSDLRPIAQASTMGYLTVGESVDPQDWARPGADAIIRRVKEERLTGSVILLHDAGGDRSQTVEALPHILDFLQDRGDQIVRVGAIMGLKRDQSMPKLAVDAATAPLIISNIALALAHWIEDFIWAFMIIACLITLARSGIMAALALAWRKREPQEGFAPPISIVVAAYNEAKVIDETLKALLNTDYQGEVEVVVVDDGSSDGTAAKVEEFAAKEPRVRLIQQTNAGKAVALSRGCEVARHEMIVFLDADTHFQRDTLRHLVAPLADPKVGAVSGHAKVGNIRNWVTKFQSLEYTCGFNLDRRAYDKINAITVVPGAISAFRKSAIEDCGGFAFDTLAEDTDLTLSLHRRSWRVTYTPDAIAWTEAPETMSGLAKQRFRWAYGTMQCLWKHRDMILSARYGWLGCFSLPGVVIFQIILVATIPLVDFLLIVSILSGGGLPFVGYFLAFLICDLLLAFIACVIEGEKLSRSLWIIPMRFVYRPLLAYVVWRSILQILQGAWVGWGKLERRGNLVPAQQ